ncbi:MAG: hypothetical protein F9K25_02420 [Candidatus Contendobacter sp.]|nr:MAG: hypothetical protein F9K25_02420 [Candidatus Contendobacter sp.]
MARMFELAEDDGQRDDEGAVALPDLLVDRYSQRLVGLIINRYGIGIVSQGVEGVLPSVVGPNAQLKIVLFQQDARLGDNAQIVSLEIITLGKPPALPGDSTRFDLYGSRVCRAAQRTLM